MKIKQNETKIKWATATVKPTIKKWSQMKATQFRCWLSQGFNNLLSLIYICTYHLNRLKPNGPNVRWTSAQTTKETKTNAKQTRSELKWRKTKHRSVFQVKWVNWQHWYEWNWTTIQFGWIANEGRSIEMWKSASFQKELVQPFIQHEHNIWLNWNNWLCWNTISLAFDFTCLGVWNTANAWKIGTRKMNKTQQEKEW